MATLVVGDLRVSGLRTAFSVKASLKPEPNTAEIKVFNLSSATRAKLQGAGLPVVLTAGYEDGASVLFSGDSRSIDHAQTAGGTEWQTTIRCGDGERAYRWSRISESFAPGVPIVEVIRKTVAALGLAQGNLEKTLAKMTGNTQFSRGYTAHGPASRQLDTLLRTVGLSWSVQGGTVQVLKGDAPADGMAVLLTSDTGLVGSPERGAPDAKGTPAPLKFKALLQPRVQCGGVVDIRTEHIHGQFRVESVEHSGDTEGSDWYTTGEVKPWAV